MNINATTIHRSSLAVAALAAVAGGLAALPGTAAAETAVGCGAVITSDIRLGQDLIDCAGSGLVIGAPGITIDLGGHTIDGTGSGIGIDNLAGHDGVTIRRGTVREFAFGADLLEVDGARVEEVTFEANGSGIAVERSIGVELDHVSATSNTFIGIAVNFSEEVVVRRSDASYNGFEGIYDLASIATTYDRNTISGNGTTGLNTWASRDTVVERNTLADNAYIGINITFDGEGTLLDRNTATGNGEGGILIADPGVTVSRNWAVANGGIGIAAPEGTIDGGRNHAFGNVGGDCTNIVCG